MLENLNYTQKEALESITKGEVTSDQAREILTNAWNEFKTAERNQCSYRGLIQKAEVYVLYGTDKRPSPLPYA